MEIKVKLKTPEANNDSSRGRKRDVGVSVVVAWSSDERPEAEGRRARLYERSEET